MTVVACLQRAELASDPFGAPHVAVDQGREWTMQLVQPLFDPRPHRYVDHKLSVRAARTIPPATRGRSRAPLCPSSGSSAARAGGSAPRHRPPSSRSRRRGSTVRRRRQALRQPFGVEDAVAESEERRNELPKPVRRHKSRIAEVSETNALRQDALRFAPPLRRSQPHFENPPERCAALAAISQPRIELVCPPAPGHPDIGKPLPREIFGQSSFYVLWIEQLPFSPLVRVERNDHSVGQRLGPVAARGMGGDEGLYPAIVEILRRGRSGLRGRSCLPNLAGHPRWRRRSLALRASSTPCVRAGWGPSLAARSTSRRIGSPQP